MYKGRFFVVLFVCIRGLIWGGWGAVLRSSLFFTADDELVVCLIDRMKRPTDRPTKRTDEQAASSSSWPAAASTSSPRPGAASSTPWPSCWCVPSSERHTRTHTHTHTQNQSINQLIHTPPTNIGRTQGVGSTTVMITSTSMINDLVGEHESAKGGFVFGAYSLTDKYVGRGCVRISRK